MLAVEANSKLYGVYPQKQDGLFMQRVKIFGGRISVQQWRTVAQLAAIYTPQTPLHVTTRQDIEFHDVSADDLASIQRVVTAIGLSTLAAGGDSIRNVTICTGCAERADIYEFAKSIRERLEAEPITSNLPRKFKISFSGCTKACAKPFINDLGFILQENGLFTVVGAGSLGLKPALGVELYKNLEADDILVLCKAAIEFFNERGDRENRRRARLRHVREKLGDDVFKQELHSRFERIKTTGGPRLSCLARPTQNLKRIMRLQLPNGDIAPGDALLLADFAEKFDIELRINLTHGLELYGVRQSPIPQLPPGLAAFANLPTIVACPGRRTCPNALTDCCETAENLRKHLKPKFDATIHISGCPNDCAQAAVANMGLIGLTKTIDGKKTAAYRIITGGGNGSTSALAEEAAVLSAESAPLYVNSLICKQEL